MLWIHRYIFLYADDLYYSRDAQYGLSYLPEAILDELNSNGRTWIGGSMVLVLKPQIELFRLLNPLVLMLVVYILAKMATFSESSLYTKKGNSSLWVALLCGSLFFLFLPLRIAHTTIYYAACAFNYLYPMALALLYAYLLYTRISSKSKSQKGLLALLAFFVGSSTQQVGMIGIGFTVMISIYLSFLRKKVPFKKFLPFYGIMALGYGIVTYGSLKRLLWERTTGNDVVLLDVISELLKTNLFSLPAAPFVLLISLSCIFWLVNYSRSNTLFPSEPLIAATYISSSDLNRSVSSDAKPTPRVELLDEPSVDKSSNDLGSLSSAKVQSSFAPEAPLSAQRPYRRPIHSILLIFNRFLGILLSLALIGYIFFILYKETPIELTQENLLTFYGMSIIAFAFLYLFSLVYTSAILLIKKDYPFLLFNSINAIGAQLMLVVVDARFAAAYKVMFPSLLLLSVFIFYSVLAFRKNTLYLSLAFLMVTLSLQERLLSIAAGVIFFLTLADYFYTRYRVRSSDPTNKFLCYGLGVLFCLISALVFSVTLRGYYLASIPQNYNLGAIKQYHEVGQEGELILKKVPPSYYGYNLGNWNSMPYFMKQCYGIKEDTPIKYIN